MKEFYEVDKATNQIRYFRPIVLTEDCMRCYGDPATSQEIWGRNDGKDVTGTIMENWRPGEVHGAFEIMVDMAPITGEVNDKSNIIALVSLGLVLLITFFSLLVSRNINGPVKQLTNAADEFAKGNFKAEVDTNRSDEIGTLSKSFDEMRNQIVHTQKVNQEVSDYQTNEAKKLSEGLAKLASGELKVEFSTNDTNDNTKSVGQVFDGINFSTAKLRDIISQIIDDMQHMADQHEVGQIDVILNVNKYQGAYKVMTNGVNEMVNSHIEVKKMAIGVVTEFGKGNFEADIPKLPGQKIFINNALDMVRNNLRKFDEEISKLVEGAKNGNLDVRGDVKAFQGDWSKLVGGVNDILISIVEPINESSVVLQRMSDGDFTKPMKGNYKGAFDELKENINHTIYSLNALFAQINESVVTTSSTSAELSSTAESMASAAEEQSATSEEISQNVLGISQVTNETACQIKEIADSSDDLSILTQNLSQLMSQFKFEANLKSSNKNKLNSSSNYLN